MASTRPIRPKKVSRSGKKVPHRSKRIPVTLLDPSGQHQLDEPFLMYKVDSGYTLWTSDLQLTIPGVTINDGYLHDPTGMLPPLLIFFFPTLENEAVQEVARGLTDSQRLLTLPTVDDRTLIIKLGLHLNIGMDGTFISRTYENRNEYISTSPSPGLVITTYQNMAPLHEGVLVPIPGPQRQFWIRWENGAYLEIAADIPAQVTIVNGLLMIDGQYLAYDPTLNDYYLTVTLDGQEVTFDVAAAHHLARSSAQHLPLSKAATLNFLAVFYNIRPAFLSSPLPGDLSLYEQGKLYINGEFLSQRSFDYQMIGHDGEHPHARIGREIGYYPDINALSSRVARSQISLVVDFSSNPIFGQMFTVPDADILAHYQPYVEGLNRIIDMYYPGSSVTIKIVRHEPRTSRV